ncbi:hypothetical protein M378DRAFT_13969 [Amanita muscaria Koide BX008]|uniref:Uncharacterized protein n=1 Tax=Amanita muscaria (strain Koide BX008) TaxID=946122 RepID=A0A0C2SCP6_AMAMK|nr:hypothetical protein M378DRAFT_13969 [Amanita muscaria Koide BX008]
MGLIKATTKCIPSKVLFSSLRSTYQNASDKVSLVTVNAQIVVKSERRGFSDASISQRRSTSGPEVVAAKTNHDILSPATNLPYFDVLVDNETDNAQLKSTKLDIFVHTPRRSKDVYLCCGESLVHGFVAETATIIADSIKDENDLVVKESPNCCGWRKAWSSVGILTPSSRPTSPTPPHPPTIATSSLVSSLILSTIIFLSIAIPRFHTRSRQVVLQETYTIAFVADLGLIGPDGLTTSVGSSAANPLGPNDSNTIQSIDNDLSKVEFLWRGGDIAYADYWFKERFKGSTIADGCKVYELLLNQLKSYR